MATAIDEANASDAIGRAIRSYLASAAVRGQLTVYAEQLADGGTPDTRGDCFGCQFAAGSVKRGDLGADTDPLGGHWNDHIAEGYLPASGVWAALTAAGYRFPGVIMATGIGRDRTLFRYIRPRVTREGLTAAGVEL